MLVRCVCVSTCVCMFVTVWTPCLSYKYMYLCGCACACECPRDSVCEPLLFSPPFERLHSSLSLPSETPAASRRMRNDRHSAGRPERPPRGSLQITCACFTTYRLSPRGGAREPRGVATSLTAPQISSRHARH